MSAVSHDGDAALNHFDLLSLQAFDALEDGIWICDTEGTPKYLNDAASIMEAKVWTQGRVVGSIDEVLFSAENIQHIREQGRATSEYHLAGNDAEHFDTQTIILMETRALNGAAEIGGGFVFHARDVSREWHREQTLQDRNIELGEAYSNLKQAQNQLLQSEKMASIGQLAAGVAHEINNPIGYVHSNIGTLSSYMRGILSIIESYDQICHSLPADLQSLAEPVNRIKRQIDFEFLLQDLPHLLSESREGIERVKKIVLDLRDFSRDGRGDSDEWTVVDIHRGIESTLNIVRSELKYKAEVVCSFGDLPQIECIPSQINQVILNLLINAGHAIKEHGQIAIRTSVNHDEVCISVADDGVGIPKDLLVKIFDPFFTTKPVGSGTGLGLALAYGIVTKHHGRIEVSSEPGVGTTFEIRLPVRQPSTVAA